MMQKYTVSTQQQYRTVTDKQPDSSWRHPGFQRDFTEKLQAINESIKYQIGQQLRQAMEDVLSEQSSFSFNGENT